MLGLLTSDEFRFFAIVALSVLVLWAAARSARRLNADPLDAAGDAGLLFYLVQYASVCSPGTLGILHPLTIAAFAIACAGGLAFYGTRGGIAAQSLPIAISRLSITVVIAAGAFVLGYMACLIAYERTLPPTSNDAITYHLPAAVQWLQTGRIGLYPAWFYNPANSWSPLAGSAFIEWLIAPLGNDMLARFVQAGPLLLLFVAVMNLGRRLGADAGVAAIIGAAAVLARPLIGQTILAKDDLFVAAFFVLSVDALSRERLESRWGAWRAGIAIGLLLATKYTVLLSLPILLLMVGRHVTLRRALIMLACIAVLAGPWYLRNLIVTGNPIYPTRIALGSVTILPGMLHVRRSALLSTVAGAWQVFTGGYYGIPLGLASVMITGWVGGVIASGRKHVRDPLVRTCTLGALLGIALFVVLAPYGEMRFAYPSLVLMFAAMCIGLTKVPRAGQLAVAAAVLVISASTAFRFVWARDFLIVGALAAIVAASVVDTIQRWPAAIKPMTAVAAGACLALALYTYVHWTAYVHECEAASTEAWSFPPPDQYGELGEVWKYVRDEVPRGATIAYANTYFTYPLTGFAYNHRVVYAPTRAGLERFVDTPAIEKAVTGEEIVANVVEILRANPDRGQWLARLRATGAEYLVVGKKLSEMKNPSPPPEFAFIAGLPGTFTNVFENEAGVVYRINW